jgi:hypothetical protein
LYGYRSHCTKTSIPYNVMDESWHYTVTGTLILLFNGV